MICLEVLVKITTAESAIDILDRVTNIVYRNASATIVGSFAYQYDVRGLVTQKISTVGQASPPVTNSYGYDTIGRLISETLQNSGTLELSNFSYDLAGNRLSSGASNYTYSNNRLTGVAYDTAGNVTNMVRGSVTLALSWNIQGQLVSVATNGTFAESYKERNRGRIGKNGQTAGRGRRKCGDANGQPVSASNAAALVSWAYDIAGRATNESQKITGATFALPHLAHACDPAGGVTNAVALLGSQTLARSSCSYDAAGRPSVRNTPAGAFAYTYGDWNGLAVCVSNAALTAENSFDILDRVTNMVYRNASGTAVGCFTYSYDVLGLVTQKISAVGQASQPVTNAYSYDALGRLAACQLIATNSSLLTAYSYDLAGNRLSAGATNFTYSNNRLNGVLHDNAGNVTNMVRGAVTLALSWNTLGQLVSVATNRVVAETYAYDPLGRRVRTTTGGTTVYHVYDGDQCVADVSSAGTPLRSYSWGPGIDNLLAVTVYSAGVTNTYYAVKDHLGSVQALVNASGAVAESYTYDAWGVTIIRNTSNQTIAASQYGNRFMFQGREYSAVTGLYNFRARWYEPATGRWLSKDPIGLEGGLNLYVFCGDDPVNYRDPSGLWINLAVGFIIGGSMDIAAQMLIEGKSFSELDGLSILTSAAAGSLGVGLGAGVAKLTGNIVARAALNGLGSAGIGGGLQIGSNLVNGNKWNCDLEDAMIASGLLGALGSLAGDGLERGYNKLSQNSDFISNLNDGSKLFELNEMPYLLPNEQLPPTTGSMIGTGAGTSIAASSSFLTKKEQK